MIFIAITLIAFGFLVTGCTTEEVPALIEEAEVEIDTAKVIRDDIKSQAQYLAAVKPAMTGIYFKESRLTLSAVQVQVGQMVSKGQILASLNTEPIDDQIKAKREEIDRLTRSGQRTLETLESDLAIARLELANLGFTDQPDQAQIELKNIAVQKKELALTQAKEDQSEELNWQNKLLTDLLAQLDETVITAPWDGQVTFVDQYVNPGGYITPYRPLVFLSDPNEVFVEYTGLDTLMYFTSQDAVALINGKSYPLTYRTITAEELANYKSSGGVPPLRFNFADEEQRQDGGVKAGDFAQLFIISEHAEQVLVIPSNCIFMGEERGKRFVYKLVGDEKIYTEITVGITNSAKAEVKDGLREGDVIFVKQ